MAKATKQTDAPTTDPILDEPPVITIAGEAYVLKRLGMKHAFRVARVLGRGVALLADGAKDVSPGQVMQVLLASFTANEEEVLALIADVLNVKRSDLDDAERFPMDAIVDVLEGLAKHQDLRAFLSRVQAAAEHLPGTATR